MLANNEVGTDPTPRRCGRRVVRAPAPRAVLHTDAVQGFHGSTSRRRGSCAPRLGHGHKIGGPKGVGVLVVAPEGGRARSRQLGGGQERGLAGGTHNVAGVVGWRAPRELTVRSPRQPLVSQRSARRPSGRGVGARRRFRADGDRSRRRQDSRSSAHRPHRGDRERSIAVRCSRTRGCVRGGGFVVFERRDGDFARAARRWVSDVV